MTSKQREKTLSRDISLSLKAVDDEKRSIELSFSSEEPYERWFGPEILSHKDGAVDLERLNEIGCLLFNHDKNRVIGRIENAWVDGDRGKARVIFDDDADSDAIYQKVKSKTLKGVSVGYRVDAWEEVAAGKISSDNKHIGPCEIATRWMPFEISIVSVPADASVGVGREYKDNEKPVYDLSFYEKQLQLNKNHQWGNAK